MQYANVQEHWGLVDTILVDPRANLEGPLNVPGWFTSLTAMGQANDLPFFNVRNRNVGIMYNNQDTRDQFPYAMRLFSIGVTFWRTHMTTWNRIEDNDKAAEDQLSHIFCNDLPRHCSLVLQIQQDERLKTHALFASPGYGPVGTGWGRGSPSAAEGYTLGRDTHLSTTTQGVAELKRRWDFPDNIEIPRRAALNVKIRFSEYARNLLQAMGAVGANTWTSGPDAVTVDQHKALAGIQVSLIGERLVQQRGQYHA